MFKDIQIPFEKYKPITKKNFLPYMYTLRKMLQILNQIELFEKLQSSKEEKLYEYDLIWKCICSELNWEYYPSL